MKPIFVILSLLPTLTFANYRFNTDMYNNIQTIDVTKMMEDGQKMADLQLQRKIEAEYNKLYRQTNGDLYQMLELSKQAKLSPYLTPVIQAKIDEYENQELERLKRRAEIQQLRSIGNSGQ